MTPLDLKRKQVELLRVSAAKAELELRIQERQEDIDRLREHIAISTAKEVELTAEIKEAINAKE
jgi:hypothetical protein